MEVAFLKFRLNFELKAILLVLCLMIGGCSSSSHQASNQNSLDDAESIQPTTAPQAKDSTEPIQPTTAPQTKAPQTKAPQAKENSQRSPVLSQPSPPVPSAQQTIEATEPSPQTSPPVAPSTTSASPSVAPSQADTSPAVIVPPKEDAPPAAAPAKEEVPVKSTYSALDEFGQPKFSLTSSDVFSASNLPNSPISFDERDLLTVLVNRQVVK